MLELCIRTLIHLLIFWQNSKENLPLKARGRASILTWMHGQSSKISTSRSRSSGVRREKSSREKLRVSREVCTRSKRFTCTYHLQSPKSLQKFDFLHSFWSTFIQPHPTAPPSSVPCAPVSNHSWFCTNVPTRSITRAIYTLWSRQGDGTMMTEMYYIFMSWFGYTRERGQRGQELWLGAWCLVLDVDMLMRWCSKSPLISTFVKSWFHNEVPGVKKLQSVTGTFMAVKKKSRRTLQTCPFPAGSFSLHLQSTATVFSFYYYHYYYYLLLLLLIII